MPDYNRLRLEELGSIADLLHDLSEEQWDHDSLCEGWRIRDVISHIVLGYTTPMLFMLAMVAKHGFDVPKTSTEGSVAYGSAHSTAELAASFDGIAAGHTRKGIARVIPSKRGLVEHLVHHQDIRRPLGLHREVPEDRLLAALGVAPGVGGYLGAKKNGAGLCLIATDVNWSHGGGPEVRGKGEALLLALTGRPIALEELSGDGVATLSARVTA